MNDRLIERKLRKNSIFFLLRIHQNNKERSNELERITKIFKKEKRLEQSMVIIVRMESNPLNWNNCAIRNDHVRFVTKSLSPQFIDLCIKRNNFQHLRLEAKIQRRLRKV